MVSFTKKLRTKIHKKKTESINQFLDHIYKQLKTNSFDKMENNCDMSDIATLSNNNSSSINQIDNESSNSLVTANNSDSYSVKLFDKDRFYVKECLDEDSFDWECYVYLKLLDKNITPQIMFANKSSLKIVYDTRNLISLYSFLKSFQSHTYINESSFSLFLHDLFCFVSSLNSFMIHNSLTLHNIFYDSIHSNFYITDLQDTILLSNTDEYVLDSSSGYSSQSDMTEFTDIIHIHKLLCNFITNISLTKLVNRIFVCYFPVDYIKLYKTI